MSPNPYQIIWQKAKSPLPFTLCLYSCVFCQKHWRENIGRIFEKTTRLCHPLQTADQLHLIATALRLTAYWKSIRGQPQSSTTNELWDVLMNYYFYLNLRDLIWKPGLAPADDSNKALQTILFISSWRFLTQTADTIIHLRQIKHRKEAETIVEQLRLSSTAVQPRGSK